MMQKKEQDNTEHTKKQHQSLRAKNNWAKVRSMFMSKNKQKSSLCETTKKKILNKQYVQKKQTKIERENVGKILQILENQYKNIDAIVKTQNLIIQSKLQSIVTYRPIPKIQYLTNQQITNKNIDTTGCWVWQAEEILAYYLCKHFNEQFSKCLNICEIGAGCSGLASLALAKKFTHIQKVTIHMKITDGKGENIPFLVSNFYENSIDFAQCLEYKWGEEKFSEQFDLIVGADCLFFQNFHEELIMTLCMYLSCEGKALFINPKRGNSMNNFLTKLMNDKFTGQKFSFTYQVQKFEDQSCSFPTEQQQSFFIITIKKQKKQKHSKQQQ